MKGQHRVILYALCLAVVIVDEVTTTNGSHEGNCNCSDWTTKSKTTAISTTLTTPTTNSPTASFKTATSPTTTTPTTTTTTTTSTPTATTTPTNTTHTATTTPTNTTHTATTTPTTTTPTNTTTTTPTTTTPTNTTTTTSTNTTPTNTTTTTPTNTTSTTPTNTTTTTPTATATLTTTTATTTLTTTTPTTTTPTHTPHITTTTTTTTIPTMTIMTTTARHTAIDCREWCRKKDITSYSPPTLSYSSANPEASPQPTKYPSHEPDLKKISIPLAIIVIGNFSKSLTNISTTTYKKYYNAFNSSLTELYKDTSGFISVDIDSFFKGSIGCNFGLNVAPTPSFNVQDLNSSLFTEDYSTFSVCVENNSPLKVDIEKTRTAMLNAFTDPCKAFQVNCSHDTFCVVDTGKFVCSHKCNTNNICAKNGECFVDTHGTVKCRCREDSMYVYKGDTCKEKVMVFFSGKNTAIIGASAGAVIACLLLLFIFLGARWRHKRIGKTTDEKLSDPEEIRKDNSQIENVPMDGVGKTNPMYRPDKSDHHDERHGDYYPGERSDRDNIYEDELAYNEGRYYRVLKDPDNRSKAYVYQPSNMSIPNQRSSTASKFDDLDSKPLSYHLRPEKEQQSFHDMVDTDQPYSIRRPQIMRSTVNSDGYR